eukprot:TRINITY_DN66005_c4_g1_i1.p1 TRINITY_DN66005_c4_g1~~TRINITY_DN66005_c4_g1_i1.p1  ORF type:complete len:730 (-),score=359.73 TRINITY_DN66005_c4_g1_i1:872-2755(-)
MTGTPSSGSSGSKRRPTHKSSSKHHRSSKSKRSSKPKTSSSKKRSSGRSRRASTSSVSSSSHSGGGQGGGGGSGAGMPPATSMSSPPQSVMASTAHAAAAAVAAARKALGSAASASSTSRRSRAKTTTSRRVMKNGADDDADDDDELRTRGRFTNPQLTQAERRAKHRAVQVRRRQRINALFQKLHELSDATDNRKRFILHAAVDKIQALKSKVQEMEQEMTMLRAAAVQQLPSSTTHVLKLEPSTALGAAGAVTETPAVVDAERARQMASSLEWSPCVDLRQVFYASTVPMDVVSMGGKFLDCNDAFCRLVGYSKRDLVDKSTFFGLTHPDSLPVTFSMLSKLTQTRPYRACQVTKKYVNSKGEIFYASLVCWIVTHADDKDNAMCIQAIVMPIDNPDEQTIREATKGAASSSAAATANAVTAAAPSSSPASSSAVVDTAAAAEAAASAAACATSSSSSSSARVGAAADPTVCAVAVNAMSRKPAGHHREEGLSSPGHTDDSVAGSGRDDPGDLASHGKATTKRAQGHDHDDHDDDGASKPMDVDGNESASSDPAMPSITPPPGTPATPPVPSMLNSAQDDDDNDAEGDDDDAEPSKTRAEATTTTSTAAVVTSASTTTATATEDA